MYLMLFLDHAVITVGKPNFSYKKKGGGGSNKQEISELLKYYSSIKSFYKGL